MDWLKYVLDWLHTPNGLLTFMVILLTSVVTTIVGIAIPAFGKMIWKFPHYLSRLFKRWRTMLRSWLYWLRYHPECSITNKGKIDIKRIDTRYKITLLITLSCKNRDDLEILTLNYESLAIQVKPHKMKGRKQPYCLRYGTGERAFQIHPLKTVENAVYTLETWSSIKPRLNDSVLCKPLNLGNASLKGINRVLTTKTFDAEVDWGDLR